MGWGLPNILNRQTCALACLSAPAHPIITELPRGEFAHAHSRTGLLRRWLAMTKGIKYRVVNPPLSLRVVSSPREDGRGNPEKRQWLLLTGLLRYTRNDNGVEVPSHGVTTGMNVPVAQ